MSPCPPLSVHILYRDYGTVTEHSCTQLKNFCPDFAADIFPALCTALHSGTQPAKQHAARVLRNLTSRQGSNKIKAASAGAVPCLIALMRSEDAGDRSAAAAALANLICGCTLAREEASAKGAVPLLLDMLDGAESPAGKEAALSALATILGQVEPPSVPSELVTRDHVAEVILLLQSGPETSRRAAVRLVKALAAGWGGRRKAELADAGAVTPLVALLTAQELATRQTAAAAVRVLAHKCDSNRHSFIQAGVASPLVGLLSMDCHGLETDHTREEAASALAVLTANNHYRQGEMIAAAGAIPPLVAILQAEDSRWETLAAAASTLANLACLPACQEAVLHAGTVALLLRLLRSHSPAGSQADLSGRSRCQEAAARALANLAADSLPADIAAALPQTASLLAQLALEESNPQGQISAATALGNLACSGAAAAEAVAASGAPAALVAMCRSPMHAVREGGVLALLEVCSGAAEGRRALVHAGAVPWLAQLLLIGEDSVKEASALCIAELAKEGAAVKKAVERSGAAATLKNLAGCGSDGGDEGDPGMAAVAAAAAAALAGLQRSGAGSGEESEGEGTLRQLENTLRLSLRASGSKLWGSGMIESE